MASFLLCLSGTNLGLHGPLITSVPSANISLPVPVSYYWFFVLDDIQREKKVFEEKGRWSTKIVKVLTIDCSLWNFKAESWFIFEVFVIKLFLKVHCFSQFVDVKCGLLNTLIHRLWEEAEEQADTFLLFHH